MVLAVGVWWLWQQACVVVTVFSSVFRELFKLIFLKLIIFLIEYFFATNAVAAGSWLRQVVELSSGFCAKNMIFGFSLMVIDVKNFL